MRHAWLALLLVFLTLPAMAEEIGSVGYRFKWLGPNDKIVVEAFDDPEVPGVTCYMSHARTGGIKGDRPGGGSRRGLDRLPPGRADRRQQARQAQEPARGVQ